MKKKTEKTQGGIANSNQEKKKKKSAKQAKHLFVQQTGKC